MTEIHLNLINFFDAKKLLTLFPASQRYEFTAKKVFKIKQVLRCSCGNQLVHNSYDYACKKDFGKVKIGKQLCKKCGEQYHEDKGFGKTF